MYGIPGDFYKNESHAVIHSPSCCSVGKTWRVSFFTEFWRKIFYFLSGHRNVKLCLKILRLGIDLLLELSFHLIVWETALNERGRVDHTCQSNRPLPIHHIPCTAHSKSLDLPLALARDFLTFFLSVSPHRFAPPYTLGIFITAIPSSWGSSNGVPSH